MYYFRKHRISLFKNNKLRKHALYAVGEIFLVVVGILLAFQLNKYGELRNKLSIEKEYLLQISDELNTDLDVIAGVIDYNKNYLNQFEALVEIPIEESNENFISIVTTGLLRYSDFRRKSSAYLTLVNSGEIKLITNREIVSSLQSLEETYTYINRLEETHLNIILSEFLPEIKQVLNLKPLEIIDDQKIKSIGFVNNFNISINIMREKEAAYMASQNEINAIIQMIDRSILD